MTINISFIIGKFVQVFVIDLTVNNISLRFVFSSVKMMYSVNIPISLY